MKVVEISERLQIPVSWLIVAMPTAAAFALWITGIFYTAQTNASDLRKLSSRVNYTERHTRYVEEDVAWLRGRQDPGFSAVKNNRRVEDQIGELAPGE